MTLLRPAEAAAFLQVAPTTVLTMARSGRLPYLKVGRQYRFCKSAGWGLTGAYTRSDAA